jgi:CRISPR-associated protein Csm3
MTATVVTRPQKPLLGKVTIKSTLVVETGLHIGGGNESLDIGGIDKPVVRDPVTLQPYLPGSSIKGKLRSILERLLEKPLNRSGGSDTFRYESDDLEDGYTDVSKNSSVNLFVKYQGAKTCPLSRVFGSTGGSNCWIRAELAKSQELKSETKQPIKIDDVDHIKIRGRNAPARLIVRDSHLSEASAEQLGKIETGLYMTEWKFENGMDRITAAANPRQLERVPAGAKFDFEMVYTVEDAEQAVEDLQNLAIALAILEDDALGGHGSRGYGKVKFENFNFFYRSVDQYRQIVSGQGDTKTPILQSPNTAALLENFGSLRTQVEQRLLPGEPPTP